MIGCAGTQSASRYTALNGVVYLIAGTTLIVWPGVVQTLFREEAFVGHEGALMRVIGLTVVVLEAAETKSGRPDERPVPEILTPHIDRWLEFWRPLFLAPADAFWSSTKGGSLAYTYVGQLITETTLGELGVAVNPHLFRDCAVYTVATQAGDRMGIASGLLQHTDDRTIQRHYNKGAVIAATQRYHQILDQLTGD